jgi:hypothetical protein
MRGVQSTAAAPSRRDLARLDASIILLIVVLGLISLVASRSAFAHQTGTAESKFKLGPTIPAKFVLTNASGQVVQQAVAPVHEVGESGLVRRDHRTED